MNFFTDNEDLRFHFERGVAWDRFVPLWEDCFRSPEGPQNLKEAVELYGTALGELGEYAAREVAPRAAPIDQQGVRFEGGQVLHPPPLLENIAGLRRMGMMALNLPREVGGYNFPFTVGAMVLEILSRACTNTMLLYAFHQGPAVMVLRFGTKDQVERWVKPLAEGTMSGAVAMTEPDAGSDIGNVQTAAVPDGDRWRLTGRKQFITNGCGDVCIVLARSEPGSKGLEGLSLFVVPRREDGRDNYAVAKPERKFVIRGSATCELAFDGSCAELLGPRGQGFAEILTFMNEARIAVAIQGLGLCQAALEASKAYAARRVQMGRPIAKHELVADMLLDMEAETAALRALVYRCTQLQDRIIGLEQRSAKADAKEIRRAKRALRDRTPLVKWFGAERTLWITRAAVQVHGGYGVIQDYEVERHYRDALILPIYEGTSQIQALMSLKDQMRWAVERPWRLLGGPVRVEAPPDPLGDALREMAGEYNRALKGLLRESVGAAGLLRALAGRGSEPPRERLAYALLSAERLCAMLSYIRAGEALAFHAAISAPHRKWAERFLSRSLALVRMHGTIIRSGDRSTLAEC
jgi:alkylation response protein AidB-like acyl-CoA dehydrogenase